MNRAFRAQPVAASTGAPRGHCGCEVIAVKPLAQFPYNPGCRVMIECSARGLLGPHRNLNNTGPTCWDGHSDLMRAGIAPRADRSREPVSSQAKQSQAR